MEAWEVTVTADHAVAAARSAMYQGLSRLFGYPQEALSPGAIAAALRCPLDTLVQARAELEPLLAELETLEALPLDEWCAVYTALFDNCQGRAAVSLYEKEYGNGEAKVVWEETIRFYEHFGLNFDVREARDWPDHIRTELEFMHYLSFLEAAAEAGGETYRQAQGDFLVRHLGRWAPRFACQVEGAERCAPYGLFARLVAAFVAADLHLLDRRLEPAAPWVPQHEAQSGTPRKSWIPIVDVSQEEPFTY